jgi:hypothetical protein
MKQLHDEMNQVVPSAGYKPCSDPMAKLTKIFGSGSSLEQCTGT